MLLPGYVYLHLLNITSPNFPGLYPPNTVCTYRIHRASTMFKFDCLHLSQSNAAVLCIPCAYHFCNSLLYGLSDLQISKLQKIQNSAARLVKRMFANPYPLITTSGLDSFSLNFSMFVSPLHPISKNCHSLQHLI